MEENRLPSILGKRVEKNKDNKFGYVDVDLNKISIKGPTVLCLGGNYVVGRKLSNGLAKFVFNLINTTPKNKNLDVYSLMYGSYDNNPMAASVSMEEIDNIANNLFVPLVFKNGKRIDTKSAQKNMRNITIVSHCYGTDVANVLSCMIGDKMMKLGYSKQEVVSILKQVTNIAYAPHQAKIFPLFSVIDFYSLKDKYKNFYPKLKKANKELFAASKLDKKENHLTVVVDSLLGNFEDGEVFDEHTIDLLNRNEDWKLRPTTEENKQTDLQKQFIKNHSNKTKEELFSRADCISQCFGLCVAESVSNSFENNKTDELLKIDLEKLETNIMSFVESQSNKEKIVDYLSSKKDKKEIKTL